MSGLGASTDPPQLRPIDRGGNFVVIENQFGKTDHDHLGKLLTYAATLNASGVVWIAERFTDEHRKAFEWLNDRTSDDLSLYAVELVLWQIDQSKPAVQFNVLSRPSEIVRKATAVKFAGPITDAKKMQLEFWTGGRRSAAKAKGRFFCANRTVASASACFWKTDGAQCGGYFGNGLRSDMCSDCN